MFVESPPDGDFRPRVTAPEATIGVTSIDTHLPDLNPPEAVTGAVEMAGEFCQVIVRSPHELSATGAAVTPNFESCVAYTSSVALFTVAADPGTEKRR